MITSEREQGRGQSSRRKVGLAAFGCGCFDDWSDDPPEQRQEQARAAVAALVASVLEDQQAG